MFVGVGIRRYEAGKVVHPTPRSHRNRVFFQTASPLPKSGVPFSSSLWIAADIDAIPIGIVAVVKGGGGKHHFIPLQALSVKPSPIPRRPISLLPTRRQIPAAA